MWELFDMIYVINLNQCADRREHIRSEFRRVGIPDDKYLIVPAVDGDRSDRIKAILKNRGVEKLENDLYTHWKNLNKYQMANWCSYIKVWEDVAKREYEIVMICEDDITFTDYYKPVVETLFNYEYLLQTGIDPAKPLLIGVGSGYQKKVHNCRGKKVELTMNNPSKTRDCNPCHIINLPMAKLLIENTGVIDRASDVFIHHKIGDKVQHYWAVPEPVYELSWNPLVKKFESMIERPINKKDVL